jgi:hypothetical protein
MWSAGIEPAAPRVSGERSTAELRPRGWARLDSNQRPPVCKTGAQPTELLARRVPGQGVEPRSPRSERGVLPVRRSRIVDGASAPLRPARSRARRNGDRFAADLDCSVTSRTGQDVVFHATRQPFDPGSRAGACAFCRRRRPTWRGFGARASVARREIGRRKHTLPFRRDFHADA